MPRLHQGAGQIPFHRGLANGVVFGALCDVVCSGTVRWSTGQDLAEHRAQPEDIGPLIDSMYVAARLLGSEVGHGPHDRTSD